MVGHNIQFGSGDTFYQSAGYFEDFLFKFIYSFHMPLFALLSGYLFYWTMKKPTKIVVRRRFTSLVLPILCWVTLERVINAVTLIANNNFNILNFLHDYASLFVRSFWFLWGIFWCSLLVIFVEKNLKCEKNNNRVWIYGLIMFLCLFAPTKLNAHMYAFIYPYFVTGFLFNKLNGGDLYNKYVKKDWIALVIGFIGFAILFIFYNHASYIYTTAMNLFGGNGAANQLGIDVYRWGVGFAGSIFIIMLCKMVSDKWSSAGVILIAYFGQISLGIYILNSYVNRYIMMRLTWTFTPNVFVWIVETVISMLVYSIVVEIIKKIPVIKKLLLGGR